MFGQLPEKDLTLLLSQILKRMTGLRFVGIMIKSCGEKKTKLYFLLNICFILRNVAISNYLTLFLISLWKRK